MQTIVSKLTGLAMGFAQINDTAIHPGTGSMRKTKIN